MSTTNTATHRPERRDAAPQSKHSLKPSSKVNVMSQTAPLEQTVAAAEMVAAEMESFADAITHVTHAVTAVWPLKDYVAVNPYGGVTEHPFADARSVLRRFSDVETLMPVAYYAKRFQSGELTNGHIEAAIAELNLAVDAASIVQKLSQTDPANVDADVTGGGANPNRVIRTVSESIDGASKGDWTRIILDEVSKYCAAHFDDGQSVWANPWKDRTLYQAWLASAQHDHNVEWLGITGFRGFVKQLPESVDEAIVLALRWIGVPQMHWKEFLLCQAFAVPGWSAWAKYQVDMAARSGDVDAPGHEALKSLLAIRLAYEASLCETASYSFSIDDDAQPQSEDADARLVLLKASEIAYRDPLLRQLVDAARAGAASQTADGHAADEQTSNRQALAQIVFCIDVRSERYRRNLESVADDVQTYGFAGFFGLPIEFVPIGQSCGQGQVPVLLTPQFKVRETIRGASSDEVDRSVQRKGAIRAFRKAWKQFQSSAVGCFAFVETAGLLYAGQLLRRSLTMPSRGTDYRFDGVDQDRHDDLKPTMDGLDEQGVTAAKQIEMAEAVLKGIGITTDFAKFVVLCGHGSQTDNNPLAAGLDCGACGGHTGESNARFAAMLLNQTHVRSGLADRGIEVPADTRFVAALHNTTTDAIEVFDVSEIPAPCRSDFDRLTAATASATEITRAERLPTLASESIGDLMRRSMDWSEVRPEWGLAGNAAFIVAPRSLTASIDLGGRSFLHTYDHRCDPEGNVLEVIMTAPMVVAHLINFQYYASTVDHLHFGSGTKTVHNVVGRFGVFSGNGGDLMTGLPWQSLHTGQRFQHEPIRLTAVIAAPRAMIDRVIAKHAGVKTLLDGGWLHLVAIDDQTAYRYVGGAGDQAGWTAIAAAS
jgi:uncharacterized protein